MNKLPRQAKLFGAVSLLNDFASEMVYPLLPAFVTSVLGGGPAVLGALDGAADFASAVVKYGAGRLADRPRRRGPLIVSGYAVAVLVRPLIALTGAAWQVIGLRVVDRVGKGIRTPPRDALIADFAPLELRGRAFGLQRGLDHAGAVLGPLAAWWLLSSGAADVRGVIAASLVPGVLVLGLAIWAVRDGGGRGGMGEDGVSAPVPPPSFPVLPRLPPSLLAISLFYLLRMPETLVILWAQRLGVPVTLVPVLWAGVHVVKSGASFAGGWLADRLGASRTMWLGWLTYALISAAMAVVARPGAAWALFLALGLVAGLTESPERAVVARLAGTRQGSGFGVYHAVTGSAALAGGLALGLMFQRFGAGPALWASALGGLALVLTWPILSPLTMRD
ncbi:MAG: MFS transporter [Gemmatimonadales bacterium]